MSIFETWPGRRLQRWACRDGHYTFQRFEHRNGHLVMRVECFRCSREELWTAIR